MARLAYVAGFETNARSSEVAAAISGAFCISGSELVTEVGKLLWPGLSPDEAMAEAYKGIPRDIPFDGWHHALIWVMTTTCGYQLSQTRRVVAVGQIFVVHAWRDALEAVAEACFCVLSCKRMLYFRPPAATEFAAEWEPKLSKLSRDTYSDWQELRHNLKHFLGEDE